MIHGDFARVYFWAPHFNLTTTIFLAGCRAVRNLKYMLLCKVMTSDAADVQAIVNNKTAQRYHGDDIEAMRAVAQAHHERSLQSFSVATTTYQCVSKL